MPGDPEVERDVAELPIDCLERNRNIEVDKRRCPTVILPSTANKRKV